MQEYLPLPPLHAEQVPPALVLGGSADNLVDNTDVEVCASVALAGVCLIVPPSTGPRITMQHWWCYALVVGGILDRYARACTLIGLRGACRLLHSMCMRAR